MFFFSFFYLPEAKQTQLAWRSIIIFIQYLCVKVQWWSFHWKSFESFQKSSADPASDMFVFLLLCLLPNIDTNRNRDGSMNILNFVQMQIYVFMRDCSFHHWILFCYSNLQREMINKFSFPKNTKKLIVISKMITQRRKAKFGTEKAKFHHY